MDGEATRYEGVECSPLLTGPFGFGLAPWPEGSLRRSPVIFRAEVVDARCSAGRGCDRLAALVTVTAAY